MSWFVVVSPPVTTGGYGYEPPETGCDVALVEAPNRKAARWAAWRLWKSLKTPWAKEAPWADIHPLSGVRVEDATTEDIQHPGAWEPYVVSESF